MILALQSVTPKSSLTPLGAAGRPGCHALGCQNIPRLVTCESVAWDPCPAAVPRVLNCQTRFSDHSPPCGGEAHRPPHKPPPELGLGHAQPLLAPVVHHACPAVQQQEAAGDRWLGAKTATGVKEVITLTGTTYLEKRTPLVNKINSTNLSASQVPTVRCVYKIEALPPAPQPDRDTIHHPLVLDKFRSESWGRFWAQPAQLFMCRRSE